MKKEQPTISSPCVDICALDDNDICMGCYRHGNEISHWGDYSNKQKTSVLERCHQRSHGRLISYSEPKN